jgi:hypothetical protein
MTEARVAARHAASDANGAAGPEALAGGWAAMWLAFEILVQAQGDVIKDSRPLALLAGIGAGLIIAAPALLFRLRNGGTMRAGIVAACTAALACPFGEILLSTLRVWGALGIVNIGLGASFATRLAFNGTPFFLVLRATALASFIAFAFAFARSRPSKR